jgi:quinol monooxygenase YgiN
MLAVLVRFELKDEVAARRFDALAEQIVTAVQEFEPETLIYTHEVERAPLSHIFYELYASREAHRQHESAEYFTRAVAELGQYVEDTRVEFLDAPSGKVPLSV